MANVLAFLMVFVVIYLAIKLLQRIVRWAIRSITAEVLRSIPSRDVGTKVPAKNPDDRSLMRG